MTYNNHNHIFHLCGNNFTAAWGFPGTMSRLVRVFSITTPSCFIMVALGLVIKWPAEPYGWMQNRSVATTTKILWIAEWPNFSAK